MTSPPIQSQRLDLITLPPAFLSASLAGDVAEAERLLGLTVPEEWFQQQHLMRMRLDQLAANPSELPWLLRAIRVRPDPVMVGYIGFHTPPDPEYLHDLSPGGIECGYTVFSPYRGRGYAREAYGALMQWARDVHHVTRFVLSIRPDNVPSLRIAAHYGFRKIGSHIDEIDGLEEIYERRFCG